MYTNIELYFKGKVQDILPNFSDMQQQFVLVLLLVEVFNLLGNIR